MPYKKQNWVKYGKEKEGRIAELKIIQDGKQIDGAKWRISDKISEKKIFTIFKNEYGLFKKPKEDEFDILKKDFSF